MNKPINEKNFHNSTDNHININFNNTSQSNLENDITKNSEIKNFIPSDENYKRYEINTNNSIPCKNPNINYNNSNLKINEAKVEKIKKLNNFQNIPFVESNIKQQINYQKLMECNKYLI